MATLPKVLINQADSKSAGGVALRVRTQAVLNLAPIQEVSDFGIYDGEGHGKKPSSRSALSSGYATALNVDLGKRTTWFAMLFALSLPQRLLRAPPTSIMTISCQRTSCKNLAARV